VWHGRVQCNFQAEEDSHKYVRISSVYAGTNRVPFAIFKKLQKTFPLETSNALQLKYLAVKTNVLVSLHEVPNKSRAI
jgi:hypothetical protein